MTSTMLQNEQKQAVAKAALEYVEEDTIIGVGTGSTVNFFIDYLAGMKDRIQGAVASSNETAKRLKAHDISVFELNDVIELSIYIDGADACTPHRQLVKGGGAALTREKIVAAASKTFICIVDESKLMNVLSYPVPVEVIPMARSFVAREIVKLDGDPVYRQGVITDNGNIILDVHNWNLLEPIKLERALNNIPGVVCNGIFAERPADKLIISTSTGIKKI